MRNAKDLTNAAYVSAPNTYEEITNHCMSEANKGMLMAELHRKIPLVKEVYENLKANGFCIVHLCDSNIPHIYRIYWVH